MCETRKDKYKNAKIYYRIFPNENNKFDYVKINEDAKTIYCRALQDFSKGYENNVPKFWTFETDGVFVNDTQEDIYNSVVTDALNRVKDGNNAVIFCFGQTGTGKTLTTIGRNAPERDYGFCPRIMNDLFKFTEISGKQAKVVILLSCIETHSRYFIDLLQPQSEMMDHNFLKNVRVEKIKTVSQGISMLHRANEKRQLAVNSSHYSNKGNGVFTIHLVKKYINQTKPVKIQSTLHVVDLAGADTLGNLSCFYKEILDVANGNLAKSQLEQYLLVLMEDVPEKIQVKQHLNILIKYLSKCFDLHCVLRFVGHLRIDKESLPVTISMLRFGQIIRNLRSKRLLTTELLETESVLLQHFKDKLQRLKTEQQLENMYFNSGSIPPILNKERIEQMQNITSDYLQNKTNELVMLNVTEANTVLRVFKNMFNQYKAEMKELQKSMYDKGYAEAIAKMEATSMKAESASSLKGKGSRRSSKSKESSKSKTIKDLRRTSKTSSLSKVSEKSIDLSVIMSKDKLLAKSERKSRESLRQSNKSDKAFTDTPIEEVPNILEDEIFIPKEIPTYEVAWNQYVSEPSCRYKENLELVQNLEKSAKAVYKEYIQQVKKLQEMSEFLQLAMQKNIQQTRQQNESKHEIVEDTDFAEIHKQIVQQQESLLKCEAELKTVLDTHRNTEKSISSGFDNFCVEQFGTILPAIKLQDD